MPRVRHVFLVGMVVFGYVGAASAQASLSEHLMMGNPSDAVADERNPENYLMVKEQYALSYNRAKGSPNWVSWRLSKDWLGSEDRSNDFRADESLPAGWHRVTQTSFVKSGFDRGHLCPSGDRTDNAVDNSATFLMTNMMPQAPRNNQQTWKHLEDYSRSLVKQKKELFIIAGPSGVGGIGKNGPKAKIVDKAGTEITAPNVTWKVILVLSDRKGAPVERVTKHTRVIGVIMPNSQTIDADWTEYRVSVDEVEQLTGFDFFSEVPDDIEDEIESITDDEDVD